MGCLFERQAHEAIYGNLKAGCDYLLENLKSPKTKNKNCTLKSAVKRKVLIRKIEDIALLTEEDYGLPIISNFALVDAIIQPDYMLQMTLSDSHKGAVTKLADIQSKLKGSAHKMVFVLDAEKNYDKFKYVNDLSAVNQYKVRELLTAHLTVSESVKKRRR
jgi:hypothetical protein